MCVRIYVHCAHTNIRNDYSALRFGQLGVKKYGRYYVYIIIRLARTKRCKNHNENLKIGSSLEWKLFFNDKTVFTCNITRR